MKYQLRFRDRMSDKPMGELRDTYDEAMKDKLKMQIQLLKEGWQWEAIDSLYIYRNRSK